MLDQHLPSLVACAGTFCSPPKSWPCTEVVAAEPTASRPPSPAQSQACHASAIEPCAQRHVLLYSAAVAKGLTACLLAEAATLLGMFRERIAGKRRALTSHPRCLSR